MDDAGIVIIGTGLAGYILARELRAANCRQPITLITSDDGAAYAKPKLSNAFTQNKTPDEIVDGDAASMADSLDVRLLTHSLVSQIDTDNKCLQLQSLSKTQTQAPDLLLAAAQDDGDSLDYSALVMATGSSPVRLPFAGAGAAQVLAVNSLTDYRVFRAQLEARGVRSVAVIGPGLVGCEFANDLLNAGMQVAVIGPDPWPLSLLIPEPPARQLEAALAERGARWHLRCTNGDIERDGDGFVTTLSDGGQVRADLVLSAVGIRPETTLAQRAGIATETGICTDSYLRTSAPDVYSLGDAAEIDGVVRLFIAPIRISAKALAQTLTGEPTAAVFPPMPVGIKTSIHPINLLSPGVQTSQQVDRWSSDVNELGAVSRYRDEQGKMRGFVLTGGRIKERAALLSELDD